jgi:hypothetical protein
MQAARIRHAWLVVGPHCATGASPATLQALVETLPITLQPDELPTYRAAVIACASTTESASCERLLGQLASLEAAAANGTCLAFIPAARSAALAYRALGALRRDADGRDTGWRARPALHKLTSDGSSGA